MPEKQPNFNRTKKILFAGGGTLGPVTPLLAVAEAWRKRDALVDMVWVGTPHGPEQEVVNKAGIRFLTLLVARVPRYPTWEWIWLPFRFLFVLFQSVQLLRRERPDVIGSAGGYTAVPIVMAGWLLRIPAWIHQQDVPPALTNRIMAPFARWITVAWKISLKDFSSSKTCWIGNPVRSSIREGSKEKARMFFDLDAAYPTILVLGGGGGSAWLNEKMSEIGSSLVTHTNVIHITGKGKMRVNLQTFGKRYVARELLTNEMPHALAMADVVVCRAGMGTISELVAWKKTAIMIPLPHSPQEANMEQIYASHAAILLSQEQTTADRLQEKIIWLLGQKKEREQLGEQMGNILPVDAADRIVDQLIQLTE